MTVRYVSVLLYIQGFITMNTRYLQYFKKNSIIHHYIHQELKMKFNRVWVTLRVYQVHGPLKLRQTFQVPCEDHPHKRRMDFDDEINGDSWFINTNCFPNDVLRYNIVNKTLFKKLSQLSNGNLHERRNPLTKISVYRGLTIVLNYCCENHKAWKKLNSWGKKIIIYGIII